MARYIDVDKVELKGLAVFDENLDVLVPLSVVRKALQMTPTADVVPKSEVETMQRMYGEKLEVAEALIATLNKPKTEAAKEIFEEIEKCMAHDYISSIGVYNGALKLRIAELKKKYTGEQT